MLILVLGISAVHFYHFIILLFIHLFIYYIAYIKLSWHLNSFFIFSDWFW